MRQPSQMLIELNMSTRAEHAEADAPWLDLLMRDITADQYAHLLRRVYGFEAPLEASLAYTPHLSLVIDPRERARSGLIAQDLLALGFAPAQLTRLPQCLEIAPFRGPAEALGWMYVAERSTLLHTHVRRHVQDRLPQAANATAFLADCDGVVSERWNDLGRVLDEVARRPELVRQIASAAHDAFRCQRQWMADGERDAHARGA